MKDINSSYFIERKMRSWHLYWSKDIDRDLLEEINEEILNAIIL